MKHAHTHQGDSSSGQNPPHPEVASKVSEIDPGGCLYLGSLYVEIAISTFLCHLIENSFMASSQGLLLFGCLFGQQNFGNASAEKEKIKTMGCAKGRVRNWNVVEILQPEVWRLSCTAKWVTPPPKDRQPLAGFFIYYFQPMCCFILGGGGDATAFLFAFFCLF